MQIQLLGGGILSDIQDGILDFSPVAEVSICFIEVDGKILLLKNVNKKIENHTWGAPGGKLEPFETPIQALQRELAEETGLRLAIDEGAFKYTLYARLVSVDCTLHIFKTGLEGSVEQYPIVIEPREHSQYTWVTPLDALKLNLIKGEAEIIKLLYPVK